MFKDKGNHLFSCRCNYCGDSQSKQKKSSGFFHTKSNNLMYYCHKCGTSILFSTFLKEFDPNLYKEYNMEVFKEKMSFSGKTVREYVYPIPVTKQYIPDIFSDLPIVSTLNIDSPAYQFCDKRMILSLSVKFRFAESFIQWTQGHTDKFSTWKGSDHSRIVIPWYDRDNKIIGYSARALDNLQPQKYYRIFVDETAKEHFFGLNRLDDTEQIFVVEGEIDSLFLPNCIAVSNGKLDTFYNKDAIYIPDIDVRNSQIMKNVKTLIDRGLRVCLLPTNLNGKDINELIVNGTSSEDLLGIIYANTFSGLSAKLHFSKWSQC